MLYNSLIDQNRSSWKNFLKGSIWLKKKKKKAAILMHVTEAGRTPCPKGGGQEELPHIRGQGQRPRVPDCNGAGTAERSYPHPRSGVADGRRYPMPLSPRPGAMGGRSYPMPPCLRPGAVARRSNPMPKARGGGREDQPHVQGAVAAGVQEGLEELSHIEGQEGWQ